MARYTAKMESSGRILVPAEVRRKLGLEPGKDVVILVEGNTVELVGSRTAVLREIQEEFRKRANGRSLSEELMAERRAEALAEEGR